MIPLPDETEYCAVPTHRTSTDPTRARKPRAGPFHRSPAARNTARIRFRRAAVTSRRATPRFPHLCRSLALALRSSAAHPARWRAGPHLDSSRHYPRPPARVPSPAIGRASGQLRRVGTMPAARPGEPTTANCVAHCVRISRVGTVAEPDRVTISGDSPARSPHRALAGPITRNRPVQRLFSPSFVLGHRFA